MRQLVQLDVLIRAFVVAHRVRFLDPIMWLLSAVGRSGIVWLAIGAVLALRRRISRAGVTALVLAILAASVVANDLLKPAFHRTRPFVANVDVAVIGGRPGSASFPSGHAATAFAGALTLSRAAAAPAVWWWVLAAAIAYSRIYLGVHYPLDVVAGSIVGLACAALVLRVMKIDRPAPRT